MNAASHYMTLEEIRDARADLLEQLNSRGMTEDEVYDNAESWRLRADERAIFQQISDYDWLLRVGHGVVPGQGVAAV